MATPAESTVDSYAINDMLDDLFGSSSGATASRPPGPAAVSTDAREPSSTGVASSRGHVVDTLSQPPTTNPIGPSVVSEPPPPPPPPPRIPLLKVADVIPREFLHVFPYEFLNEVQTRSYAAVFNSNDNVIVASPTGSGKTVSEGHRGCILPYLLCIGPL
jgi:hypothetical protein